MGLFSLFKVRKVSPRYEFTDEDRQNSIEIRRIKQQMMKEELELQREGMRLQLELKNAEIRSRIAEYLPEGDEDGLAQDLLQPIITAALGGKSPGQFVANKLQSPPIPTETKPLRQPLTEEQIREIKNSLPRSARKWAASASDDALKTMLLQQIPDLSEQEIQKAISIAREG